MSSDNIYGDLKGDVFVISCSGYLNMETGDSIAKLCYEQLENDVTKFLVNLENTKMVNSIGVSILIAIIAAIVDEMFLTFLLIYIVPPCFLIVSPISTHCFYVSIQAVQVSTAGATFSHVALSAYVQAATCFVSQLAIVNLALQHPNLLQVLLFLRNNIILHQCQELSMLGPN